MDRKITSAGLKNILQTNVIYCADNLDVLRHLPSASIDLVYIDPPFFSNRIYETIWRDNEDTHSFNDRWKGGIRHYVEWMQPRLEQIHRLLKIDGALYCHLDWHAAHYIKVALDDIFSYQNFRSEVIWKRTPYKGSSKARAKKFAASHDTILFYVKSKDHDIKFRAPQIAYSEKNIKCYNKTDERGRYQSCSLKTYSSSTLAKLESEGRLIRPKSKSAGLRYKLYLNDMTGGTAVDSLWLDINMLWVQCV